LEGEAVTDVIIPQTVLDTARKRDIYAYRRAKISLSSPGKRFFQFFDTFHVETARKGLKTDEPLDSSAIGFRLRSTLVSLFLLFVCPGL
jgi:hypothetical protein